MNKDNCFAAATFDDPKTVAQYAEMAKTMVPGFEDMQRMATILLAESVSKQGRVLVVGAGGGLELKVMAQAHSEWTFVGVDPAAEMLKLAEQTLGPLVSRIQLHHGIVDVAPKGPFDAATCILTMHFVELEERTRMAREIRRRLKPGAPFVMAHLSVPQHGDERAVWLSRYAAFAISSGIEPDNANKAREAVDSQLTILTPEQDEAILREAGFSSVNLFYVGFTFRGWVAYA